jgi:3-dehydroquinate synthase
VIVLVGFMGAGKSTVGRLLAEHLGCDFADSDELIEARTGASVQDIFDHAGEEGFRALERDVVAEALMGSGVLALGGGALGDGATRAAIAEARVVYLEVSLEEALRRLDGDRSRPLLQADPPRLHQARAGTYAAAADLVVVTDGKKPEEIADEISAKLEQEHTETRRPSRFEVSVPPQGYDVVVGRGLLATIDELLPELPGAAQALVVSHPALAHIAAPVATALERAGLETGRTEVPQGESSKSLAETEHLYGVLAEAGMHRNDLLVSVGGGVLSDLCGFAAATYHRGMPVVHVPTTLLAQVDAAIGGKTGVNTSYGKNLVGAIHQPVAVVCDLDALAGLPQEELVSGLAEVCKYGFIAAPDLLELLERRAGDLLRRDADLLEDVVAACVAIKTAVVSRDERERGERAHLNYGHTFGHAIEHLGGRRHGEAISVGMMCAAYLAAELGLLDEDAVALHHRLLNAFGLPVSARLSIDELEAVWLHDKKFKGEVRFVLLEALGKPRAGVAAPRPALERALARVAA